MLLGPACPKFPCKGGDIVGYLSRVIDTVSLETYHLYSIASQLKWVIDPVTSGISRKGALLVII